MPATFGARKLRQQIQAAGIGTASALSTPCLQVRDATSVETLPIGEPKVPGGLTDIEQVLVNKIVLHELKYVRYLPHLPHGFCSTAGLLPPDQASGGRWGRMDPRWKRLTAVIATD